MQDPTLSRRQMMKATAATAALAAAGWAGQRGSIRFGLVTYNWGHDLELPQLLAMLEQARVHGVELRTTHRHGVEPMLSEAQRRQVRRMFADSPVELVGLGSDERFDAPDAQKLAVALEATRSFIVLSRDVGGSGVKVKPDTFHPGVPRERTIEQIGRSLLSLAPFAADHGQQIRLEVHGQCAELPTMRAIMDIADHPAVVVCWNCNPQDLEGGGLEYNFNLVRHRLGQTIHVHQYDHPTFKYPYDDLCRLLVNSGYEGWLLNETGGPIPPVDQRAEALARDRDLFMASLARASG